MQMNSIPQQELIQSIKKANELTKNVISSKNDWEYYVMYLFKLEIVLEDLVAKRIINRKVGNLIRESIAPLSYWTIFNSPNIQNNEKIKKRVEIKLLNHNLRRMGFSKDICFLDC